MKLIVAALALLMLGSMQGCATVTKGTKDTIQVQVSNCSKPMDCTATNKKGTWSFSAPGPITFRKSDQDLTITCHDGDEVITETMRPTRGGMIWGNILIGGIIGGGLDAVTDAHWNMSDTLILHRNNCGQVNLTSQSQNDQPTEQHVQPSGQKAPPAHQYVQPTEQHVQPSSQQAQPAPQNVQPTEQYVQPSNQKAQPAPQNVQRNHAANRPNYIVPPRSSSLREVDARDKEDCELIASITKNTGGTEDVSKSVAYAKKAALTEAAKTGADSYFISNAEISIYGASVSLDALDCD